MDIWDSADLWKSSLQGNFTTLESTGIFATCYLERNKIRKEPNLNNTHLSAVSMWNETWPTEQFVRVPGCHFVPAHSSLTVSYDVKLSFDWSRNTCNIFQLWAQERQPRTCVSELLVNILNLNKVEVKKTLCIYTLNELVSADEDDTTLLRWNETYKLFTKVVHGTKKRRKILTHTR